MALHRVTEEEKQKRTVSTFGTLHRTSKKDEEEKEKNTVVTTYDNSEQATAGKSLGHNYGRGVPVTQQQQPTISHGGGGKSLLTDAEFTKKKNDVNSALSNYDTALQNMQSIYDRTGMDENKMTLMDKKMVADYNLQRANLTSNYGGADQARETQAMLHKQDIQNQPLAVRAYEGLMGKLFGTAEDYLSSMGGALLDIGERMADSRDNIRYGKMYSDALSLLSAYRRNDTNRISSFENSLRSSAGRIGGDEYTEKVLQRIRDTAAGDGQLDLSDIEYDTGYYTRQLDKALAPAYDALFSVQDRARENLEHGQEYSILPDVLGKPGETINKAFSSAAQSQTDAALAAAMGLSGGAAYLPFAARAYGGQALEARRYLLNAGAEIGKEELDKIGRAGLQSSAIEVITEAMWGSLGAMSKVAGGGALDDFTIGKLQNALQKFAKTDEGKKAIGWIVQKVGGGITEGLEEDVGDLLNYVFDTAGIYGAEREALSVDSGLDSFLTGMVSAFLSEGGSNVLNRVQTEMTGKNLKNGKVTDANGNQIDLKEVFAAGEAADQDSKLNQAFRDAVASMSQNGMSPNAGAENMAGMAGQMSNYDLGNLYNEYQNQGVEMAAGTYYIQDALQTIREGKELSRAQINRISNSDYAMQILSEQGRMSDMMLTEDSIKKGSLSERRFNLSAALEALARSNTGSESMRSSIFTSPQLGSNTAELEAAQARDDAARMMLQNYGVMNEAAAEAGKITNSWNPITQSRMFTSLNAPTVEQRVFQRMDQSVNEKTRAVASMIRNLNLSQDGKQTILAEYDGFADPVTYVTEMAKAYDIGYAGGDQNVNDTNNVISMAQRRDMYTAGRAALFTEQERSNGQSEGIRVRAGGERINGENTARQTERLAEGAGSLEAGQAGFVEGKRGVQKVRVESLSRSSLGTLGLTDETDNSRADIREARAYVQSKGLKFVAWSGGALYVDGEAVGVRGYYKPGAKGEPGTVFVRADHRGISVLSIAKHEAMHADIAKGRIRIGHARGESVPVEYSTLRDAVIKSLNSVDKFNEMLDKYVESYAGMGVKISEDDVWQELVCDAMGGMNQLLDLGHKEDAEKIAVAMQKTKDAAERMINPNAVSEGPSISTGKASREINAPPGSFLPQTKAEQKSMYTGDDTAYGINPDGSKFSLDSMAKDILEEKFQKDLRSKLGWSPLQVQEFVTALDDLMKFIEPNRDILDMNESYSRENRPYSPYKPNSDPLYKISLDYSTLCRKRLMTQYIIEKLQLREHRPMSGEEQIAIRDMLKEYRQIESGLQVACAMCYVEAARLKSPDQMNRYFENPEPVLKNYFAQKNKAYKKKVEALQAKWKVDHGYSATATKDQMKKDKRGNGAADVEALNAYSKQVRQEYNPETDQYDKKRREQEIAAIARAKELSPDNYLSAENLAKLKENDRLIYDAYTSNIRSATRSKGLEVDVPYYYGDSKRKGGPSDSFIRSVNEENGMRFSSWSDFQFIHLLDQMMAIVDLSVRGAAMHGYTKFPEQVRIFGKTGAMFNMSGVSGGTGFNEDGSLYFSPTESIDFEEAKRLRDMFPDTAGLQCIGINEAHTRALLRSDYIDYVIPYHVSGMNATLRKMAGIENWKDYSAVQEEHIDSSITFDPAKHDKETWHKAPVFSEFFDKSMYTDPAWKGKGVEAMRAAAEKYKQMCRERGMVPKFEDYMNEANYWKLLIDRKMVNQKTGNLIQQRAVTPDFDFDVIKKEINDYVANYRQSQGIEERAYQYIVDHWDQMPARIEQLKSENALEKNIAQAEENEAAMREMEHKANVLGSEMYAVRPKNSAAYWASRDVEEARQQILEDSKQIDWDKLSLEIAANVVATIKSSDEMLLASGDTGKNQGGIRTIGKKLAKELTTTGRVNLNGRKLTSAAELGKLGQMFRDPRVETLRYIFVKEGNIVGSAAISSRMPGFAASFGDNLRPYDLFRKIYRSGADTIYMLHNHPSGNPTPSQEDVKLTTSLAGWFSKMGLKFGGHVVVNHRKYSTISRLGFVETKSMPGRKTNDNLLYGDATVENPWLGEIIQKSADIAEIGPYLVGETNVGVSALIFIDSSNKIRAIYEVPDKALLNDKQIPAFVRNRAVENGGRAVFVYTKSSDVFDAMKPLYENGYFLDVVYDRSTTPVEERTGSDIENDAVSVRSSTVRNKGPKGEELVFGKTSGEYRTRVSENAGKYSLDNESSSVYQKATTPKVRDFLDRYNVDMEYDESYVREFGRLTDTRTGLIERADIRHSVKYGDVIIDDEAIAGEVDTALYHYYFDIIGDTISLTYRVSLKDYQKRKQIIEEENDDSTGRAEPQNANKTFETGISNKKYAVYHFGDGEDTGSNGKTNGVDGRKSGRSSKRNNAASESDQRRNVGKASRDFTNAELSEQNRQLRQDLSELRRTLEQRTQSRDYWRGQTKVTVGRQLREDDVKRLTRELLKTNASSANLASVAKKMKELGEYLLNSNDDTDAVYDNARIKAYAIAHEILDQADILSTSGGDHFYNDLRDYLRNNKVYVAPRVVKEVAPDGWNEFRKRMAGTVNVTADPSKGQTIDKVYQDLRSQHGDWLLPADIANEADQLQRILEVIETYKPVYENINSYDMAEAVEYTTNELLTRIIGDEIRETQPTYADRMTKKLADQKAKSQEALRRVREQRDRTVQNLHQHYQDMAAEKRAKRIESQERTRLLNIVRRLQNKKLPRVQRALLDQYIGEIDTISKGITGRTIKDLENLRRWYDAYKEKMGDDFIPDRYIEKRLERLSKAHISDMTQEEVADLTTVLLNFENEIRTANKMIESQIKVDTYAAGQQIIADINNSNARKTFLDKYVATGTLTPEREVRKLTGYNDEDPLYIAAKELSAGQRKMLDYQRRAEALFKHWTENKKFTDAIAGKKAQLVTVQALVDGELKDIEITPAMRMSLYLHEKNDDNMIHISKGGVSIPDMKLYKQGKVTEAYENSTLAVFTRGMIKRIANGMSLEEKAFADAVYRYYNGMSRDSINEVSELLKGYSLAGVENYYPIDTNGAFLKKEFDQIKRDGSIEGMGMLKERIQGATTPIMLYDMNDTLNKSISQHAKYYGLAIPVRNFQRLYNVNTFTDREVDYETDPFDRTSWRYDTSVVDTLEKNWGGAATKYISKMIADVSNGTSLDRDVWGDLPAKARSKYAGAVLTTNASVALKQTASYPTAAAVVGWKPLQKALLDKKKIDLDKFAEYSPLLWYRSKGFSTIELGNIGKNGGHIPKLLNWIQAMDITTTTTLVKAAMYYVNENSGLEAYTDAWYQEVADVYNRIIEETQPNYTMMQRPQILRSESDLTRALSMFKTQPFQNFNILYDAFGNMSAKERQYKATGTEDALARLQEARKTAARAVASQAVSAFIFALMQFGWDLFRGKDKKYRDEDGELTFLTWLKGMGINILSSVGGIIPFGGVLVEMGEVMTDSVLKAFGKDPFFDQTFYGLAENAAESVNTTGSAVINVVAKIAGLISGEEKLKEKNIRAFIDGAADIAQFGGIPVHNVIKLSQSIARNIFLTTDGEYIGGFKALRVTTDPSKYSSDYYDLLYKAYVNDKEAYKKLREMMLGDELFSSDYFTEEKINNAMRKRQKARATRDEAYQKQYEALTSSSLYGKASATQQKAATDNLMQLYLQSVGLGNTIGANLQSDINEGKSAGLDSVEYLLYKVALQMVDQPEGEKGHSSYNNEEYEKAIRMLPGLTNAERSYLWSTTHKSDKNNPWR